MLDLAMRKVQSDKVNFIKTNINREWPVSDNSFDLAAINLTLEHIEKLDHIFTHRIKLIPGGKCFVCELHPKKQAVGSKAIFQENGINKELAISTFRARLYPKC